MAQMTIRDKNYCEIQPGVWQQCDPHQISIPDTLFIWCLPFFAILAVVIEVRKKRFTNVLESVNRSLSTNA
jgi:hypothetical protein